MDTEVAVDDGGGAGHRLPRTSTAILALLVLVLVALALMVAPMDDGEVRSVADGDNSYMDEATYLGSEKCIDCHGDQGDPWAGTPHAAAFGNATEDTVVGDWTASPTIEVAPGTDVTPDLIENGTGFYMDLDGQGTHVYRVDQVQGAGKWLQVYLTQQGGSRYILPFAWANTLQQWVPFHTEEWFDNSGVPSMAAKDHVWDLLCVACHTVDSQVEFNSTSGEWVATWEEDGVACEACHGPGSLHQKPPTGEDRTDYIWRTEDATLCGNCHAGQTPVGKVGGRSTGYPLSAEGKPIRPGDLHDDFFIHAPDLHPDGETVKGQSMQYTDYITSRHSHSLPTLLGAEDREDPCLICHSTDHVLADEGEEPTLETALHDIECALCHDMHGTSNEDNLRLDKWDTCVQCHRNGDRVPGDDPLPPHKEVLLGQIPIDGLDGDPWMDGKVGCTDCHMPKMGVREAPYDIPSHTWYFIGPEKSIELGMPNSCTVSCHGADTPGPVQTDAEALAYIEGKSAIVLDLLREAYGTVNLAEDAMDDAPGLGFSTADVEAVNGTYTNALFAMEFITRDASLIHNPSFQMDVLDYSIEKGGEVVEALEPGSVRGVVQDADGKEVSGADVRMDDKVWCVTKSDGSFRIDIAPGDHTFDVFVDGKKEKSFSVTVTAGDTTDAGTVKFKAADEESDNSLYYIIAIVVVLIVIIALVMMTRSKSGE